MLKELKGKSSKSLMQCHSLRSNWKRLTSGFILFSNFIQRTCSFDIKWTPVRNILREENPPSVKRTKSENNNDRGRRCSSFLSSSSVTFFPRERFNFSGEKMMIFEKKNSNYLRIIFTYHQLVISGPWGARSRPIKNYKSNCF